MLSRVRFDDEGGMVSEDEEVGVDFFEAAYVTTRAGSTPALNEFDASKYEGEWLQIGGFLKTMTPDAEWTREEANRIRKKAYRFFLRDGLIWKLPRKRNGIPLRVVAKKGGTGGADGGISPPRSGTGIPPRSFCSAAPGLPPGLSGPPEPVPGTASVRPPSALLPDLPSI